MSLRLLLLLTSLLLTFSAFGQSLLNLAFEPTVNANQPLQLWYTKGRSHHFGIDTTFRKKGKGALLLESTEAQANRTFYDLYDSSTY